MYTNNFGGDWQMRRLKRAVWITVLLANIAIIALVIYEQYWMGGGR